MCSITSGTPILPSKKANEYWDRREYSLLLIGVMIILRAKYVIGFLEFLIQHTTKHITNKNVMIYLFPQG